MQEHVVDCILLRVVSNTVFSSGSFQIPETNFSLKITKKSGYGIGKIIRGRAYKKLFVFQTKVEKHEKMDK